MIAAHAIDEYVAAWTDFEHGARITEPWEATSRAEELSQRSLWLYGFSDLVAPRLSMSLSADD